tara:strand:- start:250 stop:378 length:129 start_codon:yes stop_codon:yes gene_type:complete
MNAIQETIEAYGAKGSEFELANIADVTLNLGGPKAAPTGPSL